MYTLRRGGFALIASGGLLLALILWSLFLSPNPNAASPALALLVYALAYVLLLVGLPAIYAMQPPKDRVGQAGFLCIAIGVGLNVILLLLAIFNVSLPGFVFDAFLILEMFGYLLVGWITARARVFPTWVGWTLLAAGAATLVLGPAPTPVLLLFPLIGFGVTIVRATQSTAAVSANDAPFGETSVESQA
jgi:hypothetical protein